MTTAAQQCLPGPTQPWSEPPRLEVQDSLELDAKNFAKKGIGDKTATNHANAIAQILFVIQHMVVYADQAIEVRINPSSVS